MSLKIIKRQPWTLASNTPLPLAQTNSQTPSQTPLHFHFFKHFLK